MYELILVLGMRFLKDPAQKSFERSVFSLLEVTGNIGGLYEIMKIIWGIIVSFFSGNIFFYSIISKLYQIKEPEIKQSNYLFITSNLENKETELKIIDVTAVRLKHNNIGWCCWC